MVVLAWLLAIAIAIVVIAIVVMFLNRFYRKSTREIALVRTGFGGQRILISGGCLALPFLHKVEEINMRTLRIEVRRTAEKSVITEDRLRVDVELEFYVRVMPSVDGVATAAQALGAKSFTADGMRNLLEGRFIDAVQAVAARHTMDGLHEHRAEFVASISELLRDNLKQNGILLDSVSLTRLDQSAFSAFDENNAFNAVGLRKLAEIIAVNRKKRAEIEADADVSVRQTQLEATKQRLLLTQQEEEAQISQNLEIEKMRAASNAETAKAREGSMIASEDARIERERQTRAMELAKQSEVRKIELESQLAVELKKVASLLIRGRISRPRGAATGEFSTKQFCMSMLRSTVRRGSNLKSVMVIGLPIVWREAGSSAPEHRLPRKWRSGACNLSISIQHRGGYSRCPPRPRSLLVSPN